MPLQPVARFDLAQKKRKIKRHRVDGFKALVRKYHTQTLAAGCSIVDESFLGRSHESKHWGGLRVGARWPLVVELWEGKHRKG
mmetsp:Transcript_9077/g.14772  ORF Transcript_9077/g.14772 Transcript_9077/m.14772 type:complete len:83 (+) Transcript_9077:130-378(+)